MANLETLKPPLNKRPIEEQKAITSKGGQSRSMRVRDAAMIREIKKRLKKDGYSSDDEKWLMMRITEPTASLVYINMHLQKMLDELESYPLNHKEHISAKNSIIRAVLAVHDRMHPEKKINIENMQVNVMSEETVENIISNLDKYTLEDKKEKNESNL